MIRGPKLCARNSVPAALHRPQKKNRSWMFRACHGPKTSRFYTLLDVFFTFLHIFTRLYSFVLGNSAPAALRRPQKKKHVLDVQSMSWSKNITLFTLLDVFTPFYTFLHVCTALCSETTCLRRFADLRKKQVLDVQSMSQPQNITDFVFLDHVCCCCVWWKHPWSLHPEQCESPDFPISPFVHPPTHAHLDCYSRTLVRGIIHVFYTIINV